MQIKVIIREFFLKSFEIYSLVTVTSITTDHKLSGDDNILIIQNFFVFLNSLLLNPSARAIFLISALKEAHIENKLQPNI